MNPLPGAVVFGLGAALHVSSAVAQAVAPNAGVIPLPGKPRPAVVVTPHDQRLANGLRVIVAPRPGVALVTATVLIRSGSEVDPPQRAGLAELTATLLTRGTRTRGAPALAQASEALGGALESSAGWDRSRVAITVTPVKLAAALDLLADVVRHPVFAPAETERARRQALDGLRVAYSEPGTVSQMAAARVLFGTGTYGDPRLGTPASLARLRQADMKALHGTYYRPDNAILVFAGDIDNAAAMRLAQKSFGDWSKPATALPAAIRDVGTGGMLAKAPVVIDMPGAGQAGVVVALPGVARSAPDYYPGVLANAVLGGSSSARLAVEIRVKRGLTYDARSVYDARRGAGLTLGMAQTNNPSAPEVVERSLDEFKRLATDPVTTDELASRSAHLIGAYGRSLETTAGMAARLAELALHDIDLAELGQVVGRIEAVTPEDIRRYAASHWPLDRARVIVAGDARLFAAELAKKSTDGALTVIPITELDLEQPSLRK